MNRRRLLLMGAGLFVLPTRVYAVPVAPAPFRLRLKDAHTGATFDGVYRDAKGPIPRVVDELCVFFRDHYSGGVIRFNVGVIDFLAAVMAATGLTKAIVLSAFRSFETNEALARTMFGVAEHSQHIYGRALDVHFEDRLEDAMQAARAMRRGGVGWYPHSGFIHLDSGPVRNWDLDSDGLQDLLNTPPAKRAVATPLQRPHGPGPGRMVIANGNSPIVISARTSLTVR
jgi:uncharacterized protein YcbK (DUF882 family)